jgi:hypothetical protein
MQLFSRRSVRRLFEIAGYRNVEVSSLRNSYALEYWLRLSPLPQRINRAVQSALVKFGLSEKKLSVDVGNVVCAGTK